MGAGALSVDVKISGMEDLAYKLKLLPVRIREKARASLVTTSTITVRCIKGRAPKDTWRLSEKVRARWSPTNPLVRQVLADVGGKDDREIAAPVEFGRKKLGRKDAQPFFFPCVHDARGFMFNGLADAVAGAIDEIGGRSSAVHGTRASIGANVNRVSAGRLPTFSGASSVAGGGGGGVSSKAHTLGFATGINKMKRVRRHSRRFH